MTNWIAFLPEIVLVVTVLTSLGVQAAYRNSRWWPALVAAGGAVIALVLELTLARTHLSLGAHLHQDAFAVFLKVAVVVAAGWAALASAMSTVEPSRPRSLQPALALVAGLGAMATVSASSLVTAAVGPVVVEAAILVAVRLQLPAANPARRTYPWAALAGLVLLVAGLAVIGAASGASAFDHIARFAADSVHRGSATSLTVGLALALFGIGLLLLSTPLHSWVAEVIETAPAPVAMVIATLPLLAGLGLAGRLLHVALPSLADGPTLVAAIAVLGVLVGSLHALGQVSPRRLLAYGAVAQAGFVLIGLASGSTQGLAATLFGGVIVALASLAAWLVITVLANSMPVATRGDLAGLSVRSPLLAVTLSAALISLAGLPPLAGGVARLWLLFEAARAAQIWLVVLALVATVILAHANLRLVRTMYVDPAPVDRRLRPGRPAQVFLVVIGLVLILVVIGTGPLGDAAHAAAAGIR